MDGILIIAHGSRAKATETTMATIVKMVRAKLPQVAVEIGYGYMEFCEMTIEKGLEKLVNDGATRIKAVPYFLFDGMHIKEDIPGILEKFRAEYPQIAVELAPTLGADERLADILVDRILG